MATELLRIRFMTAVRALAVCGMLAACGGDDAEGAGSAAGTAAQMTGGAGGAGSGGAGGMLGSGGSGGASGAGAGMGAATGGSGAADAGLGECPDLSVSCNGECLSAESPTMGSCTFYARVDAIMDMALASNGDLYTGSWSQVDGPSTLTRIPAGGGAPVAIGTEPYNIEHVLVDGDTLYFLTHQESSTVRMRATGSIGRVALPDGAPEVLVSDVPDGVFRKTDTNLYVGAQQIDTGLRRFELDGTGEMLLTSVEILDFVIAGDNVYLLDDPFGSDPVKRLPLAGGEVMELGGGQCSHVLGADETSVYAVCIDFVRIPLAGDAPETVVQSPLDWPVMHDGYVYYVNKENPPRGPYAINRASITDGTVEKLATIENDDLYLTPPVVGDDALYISTNTGFGIPPKPGYVLKIALP